MSERNYYVYALLREDGAPFYIGASRNIKGRYRSHLYNKKKHIDGVKPRLKIIKKGLSKIEALDMEREVIAGIGLDQLLNGNGGVSKMTVSTNEWLRAGACRRARTLLGWSMADLAKAAATSLWTIIDFELTGRDFSRAGLFCLPVCRDQCRLCLVALLDECLVLARRYGAILRRHCIEPARKSPGAIHQSHNF